MEEGEMNQLTPEQLDMIKRLQPLFCKKMGEWQAGDDFEFSGRDGFIETISGDAMRLHFMWNGLSSDTRVIYRRSWHNVLRIPKPIDWQNPERGCWGMIDWSNLYQQRHNDDGKIAIYHTEYVNDIGRAIVGEPFIVADPFTALLIALVQQEGV
jgi:hypothetical protein